MDEAAFQASYKFLRWLGAPRVLVAILPDGPSWGSYARSQDEVGRFVHYAEKRKANIYFSVNPVHSLNRSQSGTVLKPRKEDISACDFFHVDIDPPKNLTAKQHSKWFKEKSGELILSEFPPTCFWSSGNGINCLWRLSVPVKLDSREAVAECEARNHYLAKRFGGDHVGNVDRVLRIPRSTNFPSKAKLLAGRKVCEAGNATFI